MLSRCGALRLGQMSFKFSDSLDERRCPVPFLQLRELFLRIDSLFLEYVSLLVVHYFVLLIGIACCIQLLSISAFTGKFNLFYVPLCAVGLFY